ncbi:DEAD/DEAH box helicase [Sulfodiicoccus acidiphilus]|uniref:DEAD/DEAH box helicase n=1 Tax=Sulfodiicoccus acidiphilus TaxID=1670455 RepID=A0A830H2M3_9CREN|nr:DEAD/DEAH box helicase [Sulfodiicoccus acidiphilus]
MLVALNVTGKALFLVRTHNQFYPVYRESKRLGKSFGFVVGKPNVCPFSSGDVESIDIDCRRCEINLATGVEFGEQPASLVSKLRQEGLANGFCPYHSLLFSSKSTEVVAMTYPYLFLPWLRESLDFNLEEYVVIIDEAHNLDTISDLGERRLSRATLSSAMSQATSELVRNILSKLQHKLSALPEVGERYLLINDPPTLEADELELLQDEYEALRAKMTEQRKIGRNHLGSVLRFFLSLREPGRKVFLNGGSLVSKNPDPAFQLDVLNQKTLPLILMSGTLPPLNYIQKVWGLTKDIEYLDVERALPTTVQGKREWLLAKDVTTSFQKRSDVMWGKYASYLMRIYHVSRANVLALVPSYEVLRKVLGRLKGINVLPEDSRTSMEDLSRAAENGKVLILAVNRGKLSEGIELTNGGRSLISDVALVGIPFPSPDDYSKLRAEAIAARTGVANEELLVRIPALIAVKQAIGRALRNPGDSVTVWLLDKRYDSPWWKARLGAFNPRKIVL